MDAQNTTTEKRKPARWERAFLSSLSIAGNVSAACRAAKVDRRDVYRLRDEAPDFAQSWQESLDQAADDLEAEATRRARDGVSRLKFHEGRMILIPLVRDGQPVLDDAGTPVMVPYVEHEYSDTLMIFLLKAHRPARFRENLKVEHGGNVTVEHVAYYLPQKSVYERLNADAGESGDQAAAGPGVLPGV